MKIFNRTDGDGEVLEVDDEFREGLETVAAQQEALQGLDNTDEALALLDHLADYQDAVKHGVETLDALHESGVMDALQDLGNALDTDALEDPEPVDPVTALRSLNDPAVRRGLGTLLALVKALGEETREPRQ